MLNRGVAGGECPGAGYCSFIIRLIFGKAKIDQNNAPVGGAFDIAWLDVAMNNRAGPSRRRVDPVVHVFQRTHHLFDPPQDQGFG